jgi:cysteine desulfuration protein SufE
MQAHICLTMSNDLSASSSTIDDIVEDFALIDDWEERYRYVIELGRALSGLPDSAKTEDNRVRGCASQVWLETIPGRNTAGEPALTFNADSDAHIVRGLIAILLTLYTGRTAREILEVDAIAAFGRLGLNEHLTPQRSNGVRSMVERIRRDARAALEGASSG